MRKNVVILGSICGAIILFTVAMLLHSCSGGGSSGGNTSSGTVALYATDDMSDHQQVMATVNKVTVISTGSGTTCDVLTTPTTINIASLANVLQLLNVAACPAVPYNRIHIELEKSVELMNHSGAQSLCAFTSYKDDSNRPNALQCNGTTCTLDINGAVNVLMNQNNKVALDFKLKDFDVDHFGTSQCSVTLKVTPIRVEKIKNQCNQEAITGLVSNLTTSTATFDLTKKHMTFHVLYSDITSTRQPGLDNLLLRAEQDGLKTTVTASTVDFPNWTTDDLKTLVKEEGLASVLTTTIDASKILVKAEGLVSALTTSTHTFTLTYNGGKTIDIDFSKAVVKGTLANAAFVEVKFYGFDSTSTDFLAAVIEVEYAASCSEKVTPVFDEEIASLGYQQTITGIVSNLTTSTATFDLTKRCITFHVLYSGITSTRQPGLDDLLLRAEQDGLKTQVTASVTVFPTYMTDDFIFSAHTTTINASMILVKAEGLVSALTTSTQTFTLTYNMGKTIDIDFSKAVVKGTLADDAFVVVQLYGFDSTSTDFLAAVIEVEQAVSCPDDQGEEWGDED